MAVYVDESNRLVCADCGSEDVQVRAWVNPNLSVLSNDDLEFDPNESEDTWCNDCEEHSGIVLKSEYEKEDE